MRSGPLNQAEVTDALLAECDLRRGAAASPSYRCTDPSAVVVSIVDIVATPRAMNRDDVARILRGLRDGDDIPPIDVFYEPEPPAHVLGE